MVHVQNKTHFQRPWHFMHKYRLQILMLLFIHCTHISMNEGPFFPQMFKALSPTAGGKKSYFLWFVPFKSISNYWKYERKVYVKSFLCIFAGLLFSLCSPNKFVQQAFAQSREMFPSEISPLLTQKSTSPQKISSVWEFYFPLGIHGIRENFQKGKPSSDQKWHKFRRKRWVDVKTMPFNLIARQMNKQVSTVKGPTAHGRGLSPPELYLKFLAIPWSQICKMDRNKQAPSTLMQGLRCAILLLLCWDDQEASSSILKITFWTAQAHQHFSQLNKPMPSTVPGTQMKPHEVTVLPSLLPHPLLYFPNPAVRCFGFVGCVWKGCLERTTGRYGKHNESMLLNWKTEQPLQTWHLWKWE